MAFETKDSGERATFASGMKRDTTAGKIRPDLVRSGPMFARWVALLTRGAEKYDADNWMKATGQAEYDRFLESGDRHYFIWYQWRKYGLNYEQWPKGPVTRDPLTEDHGAAVIFNINGVEYTADQMAEVPGPSPADVDWPNGPGEWETVDSGVRFWWTPRKDDNGDFVLVSLDDGDSVYKEHKGPIRTSGSSWCSRRKWRLITSETIGAYLDRVAATYGKAA